VIVDLNGKHCLSKDEIVSARRGVCAETVYSSKKSWKDLEQAAFENWIEEACPSGDVDQVRLRWLESSAFRDFLSQN
jgi:hypothetical protein